MRRRMNLNFQKCIHDDEVSMYCIDILTENVGFRFYNKYQGGSRDFLNSVLFLISDTFFNHTKQKCYSLWRFVRQSSAKLESGRFHRRSGFKDSILVKTSRNKQTRWIVNFIVYSDFPYYVKLVKCGRHRASLTNKIVCTLRSHA